jgi:hypothetical protein
VLLIFQKKKKRRKNARLPLTSSCGLGHLDVVIVSAGVGTLSALGATLVDVVLPKEGVIHYEAAMPMDSLVMAHGYAR